ncbi:MAG: YtxH domain-containing protein [Candidatus Peregrinibacteria bacterium]
MTTKAKTVTKGVFKLLTGFIVGGAVGSILGITLAPKKGKDSREYLRDQSMKMFLKGKDYMDCEKKNGVVKRVILKMLTPKKQIQKTEQNEHVES